MMKMFEALAKRTTYEREITDSSIMRAVETLIPVLIYYIVNFIVFTTFVRVIQVLRGVDSGIMSGIAANMLKYSSYWSVGVNVLSMAVGVAAILPIIVKEKPLILGERVNSLWMLICVMLGAGGALIINLGINFLKISADDTYKHVQEAQFSLPLLAGILVYGLFTPLLEELLFRAAVYNRARRNYNLAVALIVTPVIFGVYHDNLMQACYGVVMGFFICWVYERFGGLIYPYIVHASANVAVYVLMSSGVDDMNLEVLITIFSGLLFLISLVLLCSRKGLRQ